MSRTWTGTPEFQSTLPVRGATGQYRPGQELPAISIHAPREGSDFALFDQF